MTEHADQHSALHPLPTVDLIIEADGGIILVERAHPPLGWALPGGFVDYGELPEAAARREAKEETGLDVTLTQLFGVYGDPSRDARAHTITVVYLATAKGHPRGGDDAARAEIVDPRRLPDPVCFNHAEVVADYLEFKKTGERPLPASP